VPYWSYDAYVEPAVDRGSYSTTLCRSAVGVGATDFDE
jgi:hypothetical protein